MNRKMILVKSRYFHGWFKNSRHNPHRNKSMPTQTQAGLTYRRTPLGDQVLEGHAVSRHYTPTLKWESVKSLSIRGGFLSGLRLNDKREKGVTVRRPQPVPGWPGNIPADGGMETRPITGWAQWGCYIEIEG